MRKKYSDKLKNKIVQEICVQRRSTTLVADENKIPLKTVESWVTKYNKNNMCFSIKTIDSKKQVKTLMKEVKTLRTQVDILKKTISLIEKKE